MRYNHKTPTSSCHYSCSPTSDFTVTAGSNSECNILQSRGTLKKLQNQLE